MTVPWRIDDVNLAATKHFVLKYMRSWNWDFNDLKDAIRDAYKIEKASQNKYELYCQKSGFKKIITVYYDEENKLLCITGSQGGKRQ